MNALKKRVILSTVILTMAAIVTTTTFSMVYIFGKMKSNTDRFLMENAKSYGHQIDGLVIGLETSVDAVGHAIEAMIDSERVRETGYFDSLEPYFSEIASFFQSNKVNATSFYVRFDPALSSGTTGVFFVDTDGDTILEKQRPTDITLYDKADRERVAWFYEPIEARRPIWTKPYYNANVKLDMISYIAPLIVKGETVGVIGVDIDFKRLRDICETADVFGKIILVDGDLNFLVHDRYGLKDQIQTIEDGALSGLAVTIKNNARGIAQYRLEGENKVLGFSRLQNGWNVIVSMTAAEAFYDLNRSQVVLVGFNAFVMVVVLIASVFLGRSLHKLYMKNETLESLIQERTVKLEETIDSLNAAQNKLIVSEKMASLGNIITGIAHEINTPLGNAITVLSHLKARLDELQVQIDEKKLTVSYLMAFKQEEAQAIELLEKSFYRIRALVSHFKLLSNREDARHIQEIHVRSFIDNIVLSFSEDHSLHFNILCDSDLRIYSSPMVLEEVLRQLIKNAIVHGYSDKENGVIRIEFTNRAHQVLMVFSDEGMGVPFKSIDEIFEPFYTTKRHKGFVGLGLHVVYNLVTQVLMGDVKVAHNMPSGLVYTISFQESLENEKY